MKKYFTYLLLFVFTIKPMYNIGYLVYYELNIDYIIETYCVNKEKPQMHCNGKCHLGKQLSEAPLDDDTTKKAISLLARTAFPVFFQTYKNDVNLVFLNPLVKHQWFYKNQATTVYIDSFYPPPKA